MPVRIIFRGLILFRIEKEGTAAGRIVAQLIDDKSMSMSMPAHKHQAEIQILNGDPSQSLVPVPLTATNLTLSPIGSGIYAQATPSYRAFVPNLATVVQQVRDPRFMPTKGTRNTNFIRNTITVTGGRIRATELVAWDAGGYPLDGSPAAGYSATATTDVRFMSSNYTGRVAGECVIDIDDATGINVSGATGALNSLTPDNSAAADHQHVAPNTVEILITNLPPQRGKPTPWSVHYQWLFKAAGYEPAPFDPSELGPFENAARVYAGTSFDFDTEDVPLFYGTDRDQGLPFPYLAMPLSSGVPATTPGSWMPPMTDPWNRPLCPMGDE